MNWLDLTLYSAKVIVPHRILLSWYNGHWWVGCYIWYNEEGTRRGYSPPSPLLAVPNVTVTALPSTASVQITVLLYNDPLLCGFNVHTKGLNAIPNSCNVISLLPPNLLRRPVPAVHILWHRNILAYPHGVRRPHTLACHSIDRRVSLGRECRKVQRSTHWQTQCCQFTRRSSLVDRLRLISVACQVYNSSRRTYCISR